MNPEIQKLFRINLLLQLRNAGRVGLTVNELLVGVKAQGHMHAKPDEVREEIEYLIDKGHGKKVPAEISPEVESFAITATGRDWLATHNL